MGESADQRGFTLIELIMVMVVLSVLAVSAIGLFAGRDEFSGRLARDQMLGSLRLAQQVSLARHDLSAPVTSWTLSDTGSAYRARIVQGSYSTQRELDKAGASIGWTTSSTTSCAAATGALPVSVSFDQNGDAAAETLICVSAAGQSWPVCVSAAGYAYASVCQP